MKSTNTEHVLKKQYLSYRNTSNKCPFTKYTKLIYNHHLYQVIEEAAMTARP